MDRAYPQWFASPGCNDWSTPINKAIELKRTGEVFLQRGLYPTKHSIRVRYGIELAGESGIQGYKNKTINNTTIYLPEDNYGVLIYAVPDTTTNNTEPWKQFKSGCILLINIKDSSPYPSTALPFQKMTGMWEKAYPSSTTVVRDITLSNGMSRGGMIQQLNGVFAAGGFTLDSVRLLYFKQAVVRSRDYADNIIIRNCKFSGIVNHYNYTQSESTESDTADSGSETAKHDTLWLVRLDGDGDNLEIIGNNFESGIIPNNRTLYVGHNRGGLISCNITGGEIVLNCCRGLTFSNNHMESSMESNEGMLLRVLDSQVTISDNFFYKSERGNIHIAGGGYGTPCVAEIHNNSYLCPFHDIFYAKDDKQVNELPYDERMEEFEAKKKIWLARSSAPEIIVGDGATVNISNQYRQVALKNSVTWPLTVGIQFGAETQTNSTFPPNPVASTRLNDLSPYLSGSGTIYAGFAVNNVNHQMRNINLRTAVMMPNSNDRWYASGGLYQYFAVFVIDRQRNIIAYPDGKPYKGLKNNAYSENEQNEQYTYDAEKTIEKTDYIFDPDSGNAVSTFISIQEGSYFPSWTGYLRMYRCLLAPPTKGNKLIRVGWKTVDIPVVNSLILYDNGLFLSGYAWQDCSEANPLDSLPNTGTLKIQDVTHLNESVECTATTKPTSLPDTWNRGDKIFNVGNETDWDVFIKK